MTRICDDCREPFDPGKPAFDFMLRICDACTKKRAQKIAAQLEAQERRR